VTSASHPPPRVLVVSVNPLSATSNNGKTIASFFEGHPVDSIAQVFFHREAPSSPVCRKYIRITDAHILRFLTGYGRRPVAAEALHAEAATTGQSVASQANLDRVKGWWWLRLLRSLAWRFTPWESSPALVAWLDEFDPQVIFFCGGDANYLYPAVEGWARRFDIPVAFYITDDYVLPISTRSPARLIYRRWTRRVFRRMTRGAGAIFTIGDHMSKVYEARFGFSSVPIMNAVDIGRRTPPQSVAGERVDFVYVGSLHSNRWRVLSDLGSAIQVLRTEGVDCELTVYARDRPTGEAGAGLASSRVTYGGSLGQEEVAQVLARATVAVHVEAFDRESKAVTALSISTKIPEYMAYGVPILAIGPEDVASMLYVRDGGFGRCVTTQDPEDLLSAARDLAQDPEERGRLSARGLELAVINHSSSKVSALVREVLSGLVSRGSGWSAKSGCQARMPAHW